MKNRKLTKSTKIKKKIPNNLEKTTYMILPTNSIMATIKKNVNPWDLKNTSK